MVRTFPLRTALFTLGPPAVGLAQVCNVVLNGGRPWLVVAAAVLTCVFSVLVTGYHLASFRRQRLQGEYA